MSRLEISKLRSFRKYFDEVEKGKSYIIIKKGKPIAQVIPFKEKVTGWKRPIKKITLKGGVDSSVLLRQIRDEE